MKIEQVFNKLKNTLFKNIDGSKQYYVIAATLDKHNNIIAIGQNSYIKTHPIQSEYAIKAGNKHRKYLHAEIDALIKSRSKPYSMMVIRMTKSRIVKLALPCPICQLALLHLGIGRIYYSTEYSDLNVLHIENAILLGNNFIK